MTAEQQTRLFIDLQQAERRLAAADLALAVLFDHEPDTRESLAMARRYVNAKWLEAKDRLRTASRDHESIHEPIHEPKELTA